MPPSEAVRPRVKIRCIRSAAEAGIAIRHGAAALGLVSAMPSGPGVIAEETISWDQPHEGNMFDFLWKRRAFERAVWSA
jgi:hypothetical protein